uniref:AAA domain-containing protein n=1 Tax=Heterorhabditis bacteriophora TaxID=37862 RepID=A0A1I7XUC1_HETBA
MLAIAGSISRFSDEVTHMVLTVLYHISISRTSVTLAAGVLWAFKDHVKCRLYECCDKPYVDSKLHKLSTDLHELVFGQHLVLDTVFNAVKAHVLNERPRKPLVMSFHGYTGSGKNYVAEIVANNTYKNGMRSTFVDHIVVTSEYPDRNRIEEYQLKLRERILGAVRKCERTMFIFDEIDKMPEQLLGMLIHYFVTKHLKNLLVYYSNRGGNAIANLALNHHQAGRSREELTLNHFERVVMDAVYNQPGNISLLILTLAFQFIIFQHFQFFPKDSGVFSSSGCKRIAQKADLELSKLYRPAMDHDLDEL